jgi:hypothetical protein
MTYSDAHDRLAKAKEVPLIGLIRELGYTLSEDGSYYSMFSPFRSEGQGSFKIDKRKPSKWKDFGNNKGGDCIDFVQELFSMNKKDAIDYLLKRTNNIDLPVYEPVKRDRKSIEVLSISDKFCPELRKYIIHREISIEVAQKWLKQATIRFPYSPINPEKEHIVLAWRNDSGGYEFRGGRIKLSNAPKNVTTIKGTENTNKVLLFEGFPDYLTYLTINNFKKEVDSALILNSASFLEVMIPFLKGKEIKYWGQTDIAGDKALQRLKEEGITVQDFRIHYFPCKDLNDWWVAKNKKKGFLSQILKF